MRDNPHWMQPATWDDARSLLTFDPVAPANTEGRALQTLRVFVMDHKKRELPIGERTLEAGYGEFGFSQSRKGAVEARRWSVEESYGRQPRRADVNGHEGRMYDLGPEVPADDIDGRSPSVVTWHVGEMHYFLSSYSISADHLLVIARSVP